MSASSSGREAGPAVGSPAGPAAAPAAGPVPRSTARPAPALRAIAALATLELRLLARRGENVLVTLVIPVAVLLFFAGTSLVPGTRAEVVAFLLPGSIALAIIANGLVSLGIATGYERAYGVLKRLGGAPLPRWGLLAAKLVTTLVLAIAQVLLLAAVAALALEWRPGSDWSPVLLVVAIVLGTLTFASLGLLLAGTLRAELTLAVANGLFLAFLMLGGIVLPFDQLPAFLKPIAAALPATALADLLRAALDPTSLEAATALASAGVLLAWGVAAAAFAIRRFRWD
jgi:ABC-2 type transport system permease protein